MNLSKNLLSCAALFLALGTVGLVATTGCSSSGTKPDSISPSGVMSPVRNRTSSGKGGAQLRPYSEKTLANGLRVLYVQDDSLPYISYGLLVRSGSASDPADLPGLSLFVSELLEKGTSKRSALEIADDLGRIGAEFGASVTADYTYLSASSLSAHAERLLNTFTEIVTQPAFSAGEVDRMQKQILAAIKKRVDDPDAFADSAWDDFIFETHPYAKPLLGTTKSIQGVSRKNLIQHYLRHYRPNNSILSVTGQITPELMKKVEGALETWENREVPALSFPPFPSISGVRIRIVDHPGLVQSQIRVGHKGIRRQNDDFVTLRVANTILGGAFASRLMSRIRKDLGLTYGINSGFDARLDFGAFEISTFTKNESVGQTVGETLKILETFHQSGATDEEVSRTKGYMKGIFPTAIETAEKLAFNLLLLRLYGIPDTYLSNYLADLERVSTSDVNRVIKAYFDPKNIKVLVYTDSRQTLPQLQPIGQVEVKKAADYQ